MLNNISGEVSVTYCEKSFTKPLSTAIIQLAIIVFSSVIFTALIGFVFLGLSIAGVVALIVLSACGLGAAVFFGRDFLVGILFKEDKLSHIEKTSTSANTESTSSIEAIKETKEET
jgi:hypothetical protein